MQEEILLRRMRDLREDHDYTQEYVAYKLKVNQRVYSTYEIGKHSIPVCKLCLLCDLYGVSMDYMVGRSSSRRMER